MPQLEGFDPAPIPGPRPLPFIGTRMRQYAFLNDPVKAILDLRSYGDVVALVDQDPALVCLFNPEHFEEVLTAPDRFRHDEESADATPGSEIAILGANVFALNGRAHLRSRQRLVEALSPAALDDLTTAVAQTTARLVDRWPLQGAVDASVLCRELALGVSATCFFGIDVDDRTMDIARLVAKFVEARTAPSRLLFPKVNVPGLPHRRVVEIAHAAGRGLRALIGAKRTANASPDVLGRLVTSAYTAGVTDETLMAEATSLFAAGHEPLASAVAWTLFLLDQHADWLEAVQQQIDDVLVDRVPTVADLPQLGKLDRVVKETLRVLTPAPLLVFRVVAEPTVLGGRPLPAGANLVLSPLATHHDPAVYERHSQFDPDRWFDLTPGAFEYLPYGAGARSCVGRTFADRAIRLMLAMILQRRRLRCRRGTRVDRLTRGNVLHFKRGLPMRITRPKDPTDPSSRVRGDVHQLVELPAD